MRDRKIWVSRSDVSVPFANAALTSAMVAASRSIVFCAETDVHAATRTAMTIRARLGLAMGELYFMTTLRCAVMKTITRLVLTASALAVLTIAPEARQALSIDTLMATP